jgi:cytoskeletal protein CcmA (bactofilin family)
VAVYHGMGPALKSYQGMTEEKVMFGHDKTNSNSNKRGATTKDMGVTILTSGCHFSGKLYCRGATRIGGTIEGQVIAEGLLVIEDEAVVTGTINAEDVVVHGRIEGNVEGRHRIELCATADVQADVSTPSLVVHDGALFNGRTTMKRATASLANPDTKSGGKGLQQIQGQKKSDGPGDIRPNTGDGRAARLSDISMGDLEPEPAM